MGSRDQRSEHRKRRLTAWLVVATLLISQASLLELLEPLHHLVESFAAVSKLSDTPPCHDGCGEAIASSEHQRERHDEGCQDHCPGDQGGSCPPLCDDCLCCGSLGHTLLGAVIVITSTPLPQRAIRPRSTGRAPDGVHSQVFRPPRRTHA